MNKVFYLVCTVLVTCSLSGCGSQNQALKNTPNNTRMQENINSKMPAYNYKDGTYTGQGDTGSNGVRQVATVKVSKGKIASVSLKNVDMNGYELADSIVSTAGGVGNSTMGGSGVMPGNPVGSRTGVNTPSKPYGDTNMNKIPQTQANGEAANTPGSNNENNYQKGGGAINNTTGNNASNRSAENIALSKRDLANAIVQNQTTNVSISSGDTNMVNSWKTAVDKALLKARK